MTDGNDEPKVAPWTRGRLAVRLLLLALPLLALDVAFWFTADFTKFVPPCDGAFSERLYFAGVTASGPLVMGAINGWGAAG